MQVREIMSRPAITIDPGSPVKAAARLLARYDISALPVIDAGGGLVGIVSEADLLPIETRPDPRSQAMPAAPSVGTTPETIADVMTRKVITIQADSDVAHAARLMTNAHVKRLPVMDRGALVGIVSRRDVIKVIARSDASVRTELHRRLRDAGVGVTKDRVAVADGVATIRIEDQGPNRRLAESIALTVPGVLEVRFED